MRTIAIFFQSVLHSGVTMHAGEVRFSLWSIGWCDWIRKSVNDRTCSMPLRTVRLFPLLYFTRHDDFPVTVLVTSEGRAIVVLVAGNQSTAMILGVRLLLLDFSQV